ncbi:DUF6680 family protein [Sphingomonas sp.]|uniref:DUF6680 family protein n=1 Tax=Sphingomonas sp. TaxID=28214 RepID=UPI00345C75DF
MPTGWFEPAVVAAFLSAIAAVAAAVATWRGPIAAARMAEELRRQNQDEHESRSLRRSVFVSIMQNRREIWHEDAVKAFNLIDVAFANSIPVREAWAELLLGLNASPYVDHIIDERLRKLLREMASDLGLSSSLRQDDFGRVYLPNALLEERSVRDLERKAALKRLTGETSPASNSSELPDTVQAKFPPKPT